jgi:hypothetical protein
MQIKAKCKWILTKKEEGREEPVIPSSKTI